MAAFISVFKKDFKEFVPFLLLYSLSNFLQAIIWGMQGDFKEQCINTLIEIAETNAQKMQDIHFKDFHKTSFSNFLGSIEQLAQQTKLLDKVKDFVILSELKMCLKMICCPYF